ncbi:hypothetical protein [Arthrobacter sp. TE12232]
MIKVLHNILYAAGYIAIAGLASILSYYGRAELGLGIILTISAMSVTLLVASVVVNRGLKRAVRSAQNAEGAAASGLTKTYSAHASRALTRPPTAVARIRIAWRERELGTIPTGLSSRLAEESMPGPAH